ncbi:DNA topoisomerase III [Bacillus timonensis]|uniref:DNA topoisomerase 3 n=1 Tax=Bacillus timonensis TaxID=1033734 RepID=A0A4S3PVT6_9BACI|nr:DNA topoisomerase III [Bacillus timonensis]THE13654.1 DNA topoisomerase III [Bacillus timonensis]
MKSLVLAEKPSVGRDIARVLNCHKKGNGFFEGDKYIVTWALGHLVTLADPEKYGDHFKTWKLEDLPIIPNPLSLVVIKQTGKQYSVVKTQMHRKDVNEIIIATDAGREGELVARWIIEKSNTRKPIKRLWISSVTDKAIKQGFATLKNGKEYENLYSSAVARAEADWLVGINATRALTTKFNAQLSCGRVQTPTLAIIAKREEEIRNFKPIPYYEIKATTDGLTLKWQHEKTKEQRIFKKEVSSSIVRSLQGQDAKIIDVQTSQKKSYAPQLYDLTELQRDANKRFGFSAKETLNVLQKLYEQHKLVTYPRTDSKYLSNDIIETLKDRIEGCMVQPYTKLGAKILKNGIKTNKSFVDNSKVTDHHAIIPTEERPNLQALSAKEEKLYDMIVKRFLAVFLPPYTFEQKNVQARIGKELFVAKGITVTSLGWKEVITSIDEKEDEGQIPAFVQPGKSLTILALKEIEKETLPPKPFNEGSLLSAMENPAKYMAGESKDLIDTIGKTGGLGTVATRADIIDKLFNTFLIEKRGQDIHITNKGKQLLELVPDDLKSPVLSAEWEQKLEQIAKGRLKKNAFISDIKQYTKEVVSDIKSSDSKFKHDNITGTKCPECGKLMLEVNGKKGKMLVCQDRECGHRKNIAKLTNARCPNCHKKMELRGEGEGQLFVCKCGHREKLSAFNERRKKNQSGKLSKKEVSNYMKKQQKEEPINTALADALAKLKLDK